MAQVGAQNFSELAQMIESWPQLPPEIRLSILTLVNAAKRERK